MFVDWHLRHWYHIHWSREHGFTWGVSTGLGEALEEYWTHWLSRGLVPASSGTLGNLRRCFHLSRGLDQEACPLSCWEEGMLDPLHGAGNSSQDGIALPFAWLPNILEDSHVGEKPAYNYPGPDLTPLYDIKPYSVLKYGFNISCVFQKCHSL